MKFAAQVIRRAAWSVLLATSGATALAAQATLTGSVEGPAGEPLVGAVVTVRPLLDAALRTRVETDERGRFRMENFHPSRGYRFQIVKEGYRAVVRDVEAGLGGTSRDGILRQDFVLLPHGVDPSDEESRRLITDLGSVAVGPYQKGVRALERGDWAQARSRLERARSLDPELALVHEALALVYHRLGEHEAGLEAVDRALELSPWDADCLRIRYEALRALGRQEEARGTLTRLAQAVTDRSTAVLFYNDGVAARLRGDLAAAETLFRTAVQLAPEMIEAREALTKAYAQLGKHESALALSAEVLEDKPADVELLRLRHEAWTALGRQREAQAALAELVRHDPGPRTAKLLYNQGVEAFNAGDDAAAAAAFDRALELDERSVEARLGRAEVYLRQGRYEECLAETLAIEGLDPNNAHARRIAGRARQRMANQGPSGR